LDDLLQQGITTYRAGKLNEARTIFATVVKQSPNNEHAWGWMNNVCNTDQERMHCLRQMLRINPKNEKAHQLLDQLLAPPLPSNTASTSIPSNHQTPSLSGVMATGKNSSFTKTQLFILLGLVVTIFFIFGVAILYLFVEKETSIIAATPTSFVTSSANLIAPPTNVLPTATLIPTYAYLPTSTPFPSPTSFVIATLEYPTSQPQQAQDIPAANPPLANSGSSCSAELEYAAAMHQYYSDAIDYIHSPLISLYQSWIDEAIRNRDALGLLKAQESLDNEKAQVEAEKGTENRRYKAERASINSNCQ